MENENVMQRNMRDYSKGLDITQIIAICIAALFVPTFLAQIISNIFGSTSFITSHSQIIVGTIVNIALITTAINVKGWKRVIGIITLPSISTILGGYVFKTASVYMAYMIPCIWLGNFAIVYLFKKLLLERQLNYFLTGIIAILLKVGIIFLGFSVFNIFGIFPEKLVSNLKMAMGLTQAITATIAMFITYTVYFANKKSLKAK